MSSTAIFIRSYERDFKWLSYCLRSIQKFAMGFSEVIVAIPHGQTLHLTAETVIHVHDGQPGYLCQQADKLNADHHTQADYILHIDSDTYFTAPVTPDFFFKDGKPIWVITPFDKAEDDEKRAWLHVMVKCLREMPGHEYMRKNVMICPRELYSLFREFIQVEHGMSMEAYVMNQPGHEFSEYNCLGFFAWLQHRKDFYWWDTTIDGVLKWPWVQGWSWEKDPEIIKQKFREREEVLG